MVTFQGNVLLSILMCIGIAASEHFGYDGSDGPDHWGEKFNKCLGKHQSPIDINLPSVKYIVLPPMEFIGFDDLMDNVTVVNNGHTIQIKILNEHKPAIAGGPLPGNYIFSQMHFHWGPNDKVGSEDEINSKSFPMELHIVFYKQSYEDVDKAMNHDDGLAVLAFFYKLDYLHHPRYDIITDSISKVIEPDTSVRIADAFSLKSILPDDLSKYFTYSGSLTTPPCNEIVRWIDCENAILISHDQIKDFRKLKSPSGPLTHNFRPIQPINDRIIYHVSNKAIYLKL